MEPFFGPGVAYLQFQITSCENMARRENGGFPQSSKPPNCLLMVRGGMVAWWLDSLAMTKFRLRINGRVGSGQRIRIIHSST